MNDRTIKLGATLGAMALAFTAPLAASAQDQPDTAMPADNAAPEIYSAPAAPMATDTLDRLQSLGFLNQSEVFTTQVAPSAPTSFDALPSDQLAATLDNVKVDDVDGITYALREYLHQQGVDPSTIVGLSVDRNYVVIAHA